MGNSIIECLFVCFSVGGMRLDIEKGKPKFTLKDWNGVEISVCTLLLLIYLDDDDDRRKEGRKELCRHTHAHSCALCLPLRQPRINGILASTDTPNPTVLAHKQLSPLKGVSVPWRNG